MAARRRTARKSTARRSTARSRTARRSTARRKVARKSTARRSTARSRTARRSTARRKPSTSLERVTAVPSRSAKDKDLAAMYLSILIVGVAGIILLFARPTQMMQKVIGILLVILGLWGLMMKK